VAIAIGFALILASGVSLFLFWFLIFNKTDVPVFVGETLAESRTLAVSANLVIDVGTATFSDTVEKGLIASQSPAAGETVKKDSTVIIIPSLGPELTTVKANIDISSIVLDNFDVFRSLSNFCSYNLLLTIGIYDRMHLQDEEFKQVGDNATNFKTDPSNGTYLPCEFSIEFKNVPMNRDRYRLTTDSSRRDNDGSWFTNQEMRDRNWVLSLG
jgi:hypothetical protein